MFDPATRSEIDQAAYHGADCLIVFVTVSVDISHDVVLFAATNGIFNLDTQSTPNPVKVLLLECQWVQLKAQAEDHGSSTYLSSYTI